MKRVIVTLTYVANVDDELEVDYIHERLEDYIDQRINMDIYDWECEDSWLVPLQLEKIQTSIGASKMVSIQKTKDRAI